MNRNSTAFQIITSIGTKFGILLGSFFTSIIIARFLGPEGKGIVTTIFIVPNLLISIADLGIRQSTAYYIGKKIYSPNKVLTSILLVWIVTTAISITITATYYSTGLSEQHGWTLLIIPLATIPFMLFTKYMEGIFSGLQKINIINIKNIVGFVSYLFFVTILIVFLRADIVGAALTNLIRAITTMLFGVIVIRKFIPFKLSYEKGIAKQLISKGIVYALALFVLNLNYQIDFLFLERLATPQDVGIYSIGVTLSELIWQIPSAIGVVLFSKSANSKLDSEATSRSTRLLRISWIPIIVFSVLFWLFAPVIIRVLYGVEFVQSATIIRILLPGIIAMVLFKILNADLAGRGYPVFALRVYFLTLIINIILNSLLIIPHGIRGAAVSTSVSYTVGAILFAFAYKKQSNIRISDLFVLKKSDVKLISVAFSNIIKKLKR